MKHSLPVVGNETIDGVRQPVYALPNNQPVVQQGDLLVSLEGAKTFKRGQYPLHASIQPVVADELTGDVPYPLRDKAEQIDAAKAVLKVMMTRLIAVGLPQVMAA